jgi:hypothetical protein
MSQTPQTVSVEIYNELNEKHTALKSVIFNELNELDPLCDRVSFLMDALCAKHDWIEDSAATGLYFTLKTIHDDLKASYEHLSKGWKA